MKGCAAHMKSYILGIVVAIILSAVYALSNTTEITVRFLSLQTTFPQGMWEAMVFGCGVLIMSLISFCESIETYVKNRKKTKELTKRIAQLEDERKSLLAALGSFGWKDRTGAEPRHEETHGSAQNTCEPDSHVASDPTREPLENVILDKRELSDGVEPRNDDEVKPSFLKTLISTVFKREKKTETERDPAKSAGRETGTQTSGQENVCSIPEPAGEKYGAQAITETKDEEKSEI
jgi:uncharacterized integral membrane protein